MILAMYKDGAWKDVTSCAQIGLNGREAKDETLASLQFTLAPISSGEPLTPGTMFRAKSDSGETLDDYVLVSDQVSVATKGDEQSYAHSVQCVQAVRSLALKTVRGADYTQPYANSRKGAYSGNRFFVPIGTTAYDPTKDIYPSSSYLRALDVVAGKEKVLSAKVTLEAGYALTRLLKANVATLGEAHFDVYVYAKKDGAETVLFSALEGATIGDSAILTASQISAINSKIDGGSAIYLRCVATAGDYSYSAEKDVRNGFASARMDVTTRYYTYYDVLNDLRKMAVNKSCKGVWGSDLKEDSPYFMPADVNDSFYKFLTEMTSPDFQFQQGSTLYDCVAEVFRSFDSKPTLVNGVLGRIGFNELKAGGSLDGTLSKTADMVSSSTDGRRAQRVIAPYQHGAKRNPVAYPASGYATPRCKSMGIPADDDWYLMTQNGINAVKSLRVPGGFTMTIRYYDIDSKSNVVSSGTVDCNMPDDPVELADLVYDDVTYNSLDVDSNYSERVEATQSNSLQYTREDDGIYVGKVGKGFFGQQAYTFSTVIATAVNRAFGGTADSSSVTKVSGYPNSTIVLSKPWTYQLACEYYPVSRGSVAVESAKAKPYGFHNMITDYHGFMSSMTLAQGSGMVSLERMGANLLGTACMTGEDSRVWSCKATALSGEKPLSGMWLKDSGGDLWVVQASKSTLLRKGLWKSELTLTKNFNKVSDRIALDRSVKMSVISQDLVLASEGIMVEYAYMSSKYAPTDWSGADYCFYSNLFQQVGKIGSGASRIQCVAVMEMDGKKTFLPMVPYASGNCLCFEANFNSPITAGNKVVAESNWYGTNLMSKPVLYAGDKGFGDKCSIHILKGSAGLDYSSYPESTFEDSWNINTDVALASVRDLEIGKKPNDIFGFNYEVCFLPYDGSVIPMLGFVGNIPLVGDASDGLSMRVLYDGEAPYSMFERAPRGEEVPGLKRFSVSVHVDGEWQLPYVTLSLGKYSSSDSYNTAGKEIAGWELVDGRGNPILASNEHIQKGKIIETSVSLNVFGSHKRL